MKLVLAAIATAVAAASAAATAGAAPPTSPRTPVEIPVPAAVVAAHPTGRVLHAVRVAAVDPATQEEVVTAAGAGDSAAPPTTRRLQEAQRALGSGCWRAYFEYTDNNWFFGRAETHVNPYWCGNGYWLTGIDNSWRYQICTNLIACQGLDGPYLAAGCRSCDQAWFTLNGKFSGLFSTAFSFVQHIVYALYGNGQYWAYGWEDS